MHRSSTISPNSGVYPRGRSLTDLWVSLGTPLVQRKRGALGDQMQHPSISSSKGNSVGVQQQLPYLLVSLG